MRHCQVPETSQTAHTTGIERRRRRRRRRRNKRTTVAMKGEPLEGRGVVARGAGIVFLLFFVFFFFWFGVVVSWFWNVFISVSLPLFSSPALLLLLLLLVHHHLLLWLHLLCFLGSFLGVLTKEADGHLTAIGASALMKWPFQNRPHRRSKMSKKRRKKSMIHLHPALEKRVFLPSLPSFTGFAVYLVLPSFHRQSIRRIKTVKATRN